MKISTNRNGFALVTLFVIASGVSGLDARADTNVLAVARAFADGGKYNREWKGSGTPAEITFKGERILAAGEGTYCSGFTFAVVMRAAAERGLLKDKTPAEVRRFQKEWYGATETSAERQCQLAVENLGIGRAVPFDQAQPGDFCQFWRKKSGHSVVFLGWVEENGEKIGLRYRSSQPATDGIGDRVEYFTKPTGKSDPVDPKRTYFCRLN